MWLNLSHTIYLYYFIKSLWQSIGVDIIMFVLSRSTLRDREENNLSKNKDRYLKSGDLKSYLYAKGLLLKTLIEMYYTFSFIFNFRENYVTSKHMSILQ